MRIFLWLAILPSLVLAWRVLRHDRIEREPAGLLIRLFVMGMLTCIPAGILEAVGDVAITVLDVGPALTSALTYLVVVPGAEEFVKYLALRTTRKNRNFDYTFDGVVYGTMVGLGFATLENILYVLDSMTLEVALLRGIFSVPLHCVCGIYMGYYYGAAKGLDAQGLREQASASRQMAIAVPWAIHGLYDFALDLDSWLVLAIGLLLTLAVFSHASQRVKFASAHDTPIFAGVRGPSPEDLQRLASNKDRSPQPPRGF